MSLRLRADKELSQASGINIGVELNMVLVQAPVRTGLKPESVGSQEYFLPSSTYRQKQKFQ